MLIKRILQGGIVVGLTLGGIATASAADDEMKDAPTPSEDAVGARTHDGFYFNTSLGLGYYAMSADIAGSEATYSGMTMSTSLLFGGTLGSGLVLGGGVLVDYAGSPSFEVDGNDLSGGADFSQFVLSFGPFVDYYIDPHEGLHIFGMVGWGGVETSAEGNVGGSDPTGMVATLGAGYDFWLSDNWSAGAMARFSYAPLSLNDVDYPTIVPALVGTITYH